MTVAIMQPYLFPYLGYFQLAAAADCFVIYDDAAYSHSGWINRNRLLQPETAEPYWLTVPTHGGTRPIDKTTIAWGARTQQKALRRIEASYSGATQFHRIFPLVQSALESPQPMLGPFLQHSLELVFDELGIRTTCKRSSVDHVEYRHLKGLERVLAMVDQEGADTYLNAEGGRQLYPRQAFEAAGVGLQFLDHIEQPYPQHSGNFVPRLSIIDVLMHNSPEQTQKLLTTGYRISSAAGHSTHPTNHG